MNVYLQTVCWDTDPASGLDSKDRPFDGVEVDVVNGGASAGKINTSAGMAYFEALSPGFYTVVVRKAGFTDVTSEVFFENEAERALANDPPQVEEHQTKRVIRVMRRNGLECTRKHARLPGGSAGSSSLASIFWSGEPPILALRETLWLLCLLLSILGIVLNFIPPALDLAPVAVFSPGFQVSALLLVVLLAFVCELKVADWLAVVVAIVAVAVLVLIVVAAVAMPNPSGGLSAAAICLAFVAFMGNVIFGIAFFIPAGLIALAAFVFTIVVAAMNGIGPFPAPDAYGFPILCGIWAGFCWGFFGFRRKHFNHERLADPIVSTILALVATLVVCIVMVASKGIEFDGWIFLGALFTVIFGAALGAVAGVLGLSFVNDGHTKIPWGPTDFLMPFEGERYCVQGVRGFISHYFERRMNDSTDYDQESSFDWSMPEGVPILNAKEGHIVAFKEDLVGNVRNSSNSAANYIAVRHRDGTTAMYLHLMTNAITGPGWNEGMEAAVTYHADGYYFDEANAESNPLHVHAGQILAGNGDVGYSMFPHLHFTVRRAVPHPARLLNADQVDPPPDTKYVPVGFAGGDPGDHNRCWSMRKYRSTNTNRGLIVLPPNRAPFRPGGAATTGEPPPSAPGGAAGSAPSPPSPPTPPAPSPPPVPPASP